MSGAELRLLTALALAAILMVPCGYAWCRRSNDTVPATAGYRMSGMDLFMGMILYVLLALMMLGAKWWSQFHPQAEAGTGMPPSASVIFLNFAVMQGMQLGVVWAWFHVRQTRLTEVFGLLRLSATQVVRVAAVCIVPAGVVAMLALVLTIYGLRWLDWPMEAQEAVSLLMGADDFSVQMALAVGACLGAPVVEEVLFRGVIYGSLRELTNRWVAAIVSALLFGVIHLHLPSLPALCLLGFFFAMAYEITGSLAVPIVMHALFNAIQVILAIFHAAP